jgi:hypothetical protein
MLPFLNTESDNGKKYIVAFRGLNYGEGWTDGELSDCRNVSSALYPSLTQRWARSVEGAYSAPSTLFAKDGLVVVDGTTVYYNGKSVGTVTAGRKQMAAVGDYVVIFPDKVTYNVETGAFDQMEVTVSAAGMKFTDATITGSGLGAFKVGDAVTISGCSTHAENNKTIIVRAVSDNMLTFYENTLTAGTETGTVTVKREVPDLDFICESNYRLWGTKGNTIYGSKYGDPFNFQVFDGLTGDSYYIDLASDGDFTGCIPYSSHVCFFKEHTLHKLYGSKPSNFQVVTSQVYGVQAGCERSMCIINETLYYKGVNGIYAYTGSVPELISDKFGVERFSEACAASDGDRYYISMKRDGKWGVYAFDVMRNMWLQEDEMHCVDMEFHDGHMYLLDATGELHKIDPALDRSNIEWSITFCPFNETVNERKGYSKFHMRLEMAAGAWLAVEVKRDTDTRWEEVYRTHNERARTLTVPIIPARCDSVEIRLRGKGECLLRTFVREFFTGSDV